MWETNGRQESQKCVAASSIETSWRQMGEESVTTVPDARHSFQRDMSFPHSLTDSLTHSPKVSQSAPLMLVFPTDIQQKHHIREEMG